MQRFLFQPDPDLSASEWTVSGMCGNLWKQHPDGYWPSGSTKPEAFGRDADESTGVDRS